MNKTFKTLNFLLLSAFVVLATACGGGGGGSKNAELTANNLEALATAGTEGTKQAVNNSNSPTPFAKVGSASAIQKLTVSLAQSVSQDPKQSHLGFSICDTGSIDDSNVNQNGGTITYNNCSFSGITFNGSVKFKVKTSGNTTTFTINYSNFTVTSGGTTETLDLDATCTFNTSDASGVSCTYNSTALGIDGRTYSVSEINVSGNAGSGYNVGCVVDDPDNGKITISTTTPITFNCPNGQPDDGVIVITDGASNTATVTFIDCNSYSVDFNGSTTTFTWP
ncbi:MAG TPA: hypothetical protein ENJ87_04145 [Gammaproteobacteria bacterium]|nr:hypothetical protein [Gammaproteobacteria bacterium]